MNLALSSALGNFLKIREWLAKTGSLSHLLGRRALHLEQWPRFVGKGDGHEVVAQHPGSPVRFRQQTSPHLEASRARARPGLEALEDRLALSTAAAADPVPDAPFDYSAATLKVDWVTNANDPGHSFTVAVNPDAGSPTTIDLSPIHFEGSTGANYGGFFVTALTMNDGVIASDFHGTVRLVVNGPSPFPQNYTFSDADMGSHYFSGPLNDHGQFIDTPEKPQSVAVITEKHGRNKVTKVPRATWDHGTVREFVLRYQKSRYGSVKAKLADLDHDGVADCVVIMARGDLTGGTKLGGGWRTNGGYQLVSTNCLLCGLI